MIVGDYPGNSIANLPSQRVAVNLQTGYGLGNLRSDKKNFLNINFNGGTALYSNEKSYIESLKSVGEKCKGKDVAWLYENEPANDKKIGNTSLKRIQSGLLVMKNVADSFGIPAMSGGEMMPRVIRAYALATGTKTTVLPYFDNAGYFTGTDSNAKDCVAMMEFNAKNGIMQNFHWQQESNYLPLVCGWLAQYGEVNGNEFALRDYEIGSVTALWNALNGRVKNALFFNKNMNKKAIAWTGEQKAELVRLMS